MITLKMQEAMTFIFHGLKPHLSCYWSSMTELKARFKRGQKKDKNPQRSIEAILSVQICNSLLKAVFVAMASLHSAGLHHHSYHTECFTRFCSHQLCANRRTKDSVSSLFLEYCLPGPSLTPNQFYPCSFIEGNEFPQVLSYTRIRKQFQFNETLLA